jgi:predicted DNA-binding transcriptional regulator AlpA
MTSNFDSLPVDISRHRVLSAAESAAFLNLSIPHFRRLYRSGDVPAPIKLSARRLGWRVSTLIEWLDARQSRPVAT